MGCNVAQQVGDQAIVRTAPTGVKYSFWIQVNNRAADLSAAFGTRKRFHLADTFHERLPKQLNVY